MGLRSRHDIFEIGTEACDGAAAVQAEAVPSVETETELEPADPALASGRFTWRVVYAAALVTVTSIATVAALWSSPVFVVLRSFSWKSSQRWVDCQSAAAEIDEGDEGLG